MKSHLRFELTIEQKPKAVTRMRRDMKIEGNGHVAGGRTAKGGPEWQGRNEYGGRLWGVYLFTNRFNPTKMNRAFYELEREN